MFMSPKDKHKRVISPSTLEYKDTTKKLSNAHAHESLIATMHNSLCQESNSVVDALINDNYKAPELPEEPTSEQIKGHSKLYGDSALSTSVKAIVSAAYAKLRDERQQRVNAERQAHAWVLIKSVDEAKRLITLVKRAKVEERGAPRSSSLEVRESISSLKQLDNESSASLVARAARLMQQEKRLTNNPTAEAEVVGHAINGLKPSCSLLVNSWALDEARGKSDAAGPTASSDLTRASFKFESNSKLLKRSTAGSDGPSNFVAKANGNVKKGNLKRYACENEGRDSSHGYRKRKRATKWKSKRDSKSKAGEGEDREAAMTTHQRAKSSDGDDSSGDVGSSSEDEQPSRLAQIKRRKKRTVAIDDDQ